MENTERKYNFEAPDNSYVLYELINPSDPYTYYAKNDKVAVFVAIYLGEGMYGAKNLKTKEVVGGFLIGVKNEDLKDEIIRLFKVPMTDFMMENKKEISIAFSTLLVGDDEDRKTLKNNLKNIDEDKIEFFIDKYKEEKQSSLNDIQKYAEQSKKKFEEKDEEES